MGCTAMKSTSLSSTGSGSGSPCDQPVFAVRLRAETTDSLAKQLRSAGTSPTQDSGSTSKTSGSRKLNEAAQPRHTDFSPSVGQGGRRDLDSFRMSVESDPISFEEAIYAWRGNAYDSEPCSNSQLSAEVLPQSRPVLWADAPEPEWDCV
mmetsp:Transcript_43863/g.103730  ORF Transcript_43863/g.103730 Transcript_43863/m.103730 type:complete len:150 (-) Transcript_43863:206-655(-)